MTWCVITRHVITQTAVIKIFIRTISIVQLNHYKNKNVEDEIVNVEDPEDRGPLLWRVSNRFFVTVSSRFRVIDLIKTRFVIILYILFDRINKIVKSLKRKQNFLFARFFIYETRLRPTNPYYL